MGLMRVIVAAVLLLALPAAAQDKFITLASTTSTEQSGLFGHLLPRFTQKTGIAVRVVALGTGQALAVGQRGDADALLVHDPDAEKAFVAAGHGVEHRLVMYNDFVIIGPAADPAGIAGIKDAGEALKRIAAKEAPFVSRGDKSGTDAAEKRLWQQVGLQPWTDKKAWYRETGSGMGPALNTASGMDAYIISDRGTWLAFKNRATLKILSEGDTKLFNQYGVMMTNPQRHPHVKRDLAMAFVDWITSAEGQQAIASYRIEGESLYFPNAKKSGS
jgi:tungstate transport system substrate-binding protein